MSGGMDELMASLRELLAELRQRIEAGTPPTDAEIIELHDLLRTMRRQGLIPPPPR
jgi:hypothetical protein